MTEYYDDGDNGGPTSHRRFYDMPRVQLFTEFAGVVQTIRVDGGPLCASYEAPSFTRMARVVQARVDATDPCEAKLGGVTTVLRVLLSRADGLDKGEDQSYYEPIRDLVGHFVELRAELADMLPVSGAWASMVVVPDDPSGVDAVATVRTDGDGRLWTELDPGDEVLSYDHPDVIAMAENDPALAEMIAEERARPWLDVPGMAGEPLQD
jgi:hypothetical protein